jgi:hypothetical protein
MPTVVDLKATSRGNDESSSLEQGANTHPC